MSREMRDSGIEWIGAIPSDWALGRTKNCYFNHKDIVGSEADNYERLALTLNGVIKRSKVDATGLQPEAFEGYQILRQNELVFKLIDLENVSTSRVGYSPYTGIVSPAYIILTPRYEDESRYGEYFFLSLWQREVFNHMGDDGVRSSLNAKDLLNIPYPLVPSEEKQRIVAFLDTKCAEIDAVIEQTQATIEEYKLLKQSVVIEAVTKGIRGDRPMKDSGIEWIGYIPSNWSTIKAKHILTANDGGVWGDDPKGDGTDKIVIRSTEQTVDGKWCIQSPAQRDLSMVNLENSKIQVGDLLITKSSGSDLHIGKTTIADEYFESNECYFSNFIQRIRCNNFSPKLLWHLFNSNIVRMQFVYLQNSTSGIGNINADIIENLFLPIPPLSEQKVIADFLDTQCAKIDALVEKKTALLDELETYKKSMIYEYVTGKKQVNS